MGGKLHQQRDHQLPMAGESFEHQARCCHQRSEHRAKRPNRSVDLIIVHDFNLIAPSLSRYSVHGLAIATTLRVALAPSRFAANAPIAVENCLFPTS